jgi:hypothetical protein
MSTIPLQFVLLVAVATSQIFGGVSCCCVSRAFFGGPAIINSSGVASDTNAVRGSRLPGKCPKCLAIESAHSVLRHNSAGNASSCSALTDGGKCQCQKLVLHASVSEEKAAIEREGLAWLLPSLGDIHKGELVVKCLRRFEVPILLGGRSWQSIACVCKY